MIGQINFQMFSCNLRANLIPIFGGLCKRKKKDWDPQVVSTSDQHVSFTIMQDSIQIGLTTPYAFTGHINRIRVWLELSFSLASNTMLWGIICDFNGIAGSHEHKGSHTPNKVHMEDFKNWPDQNNLILHLVRWYY